MFAYTKATCRHNFAGCAGHEQLFEACWRKLKKYRHATDIATQEDADRWLDELASEMVNNPKSRFYLKG